MSEAEVLDKIRTVGYKLGHVCGYSIATAVELVGGYVFFVALKKCKSCNQIWNNHDCSNRSKTRDSERA